MQNSIKTDGNLCTVLGPPVVGIVTPVHLEQMGQSQNVRVYDVQGSSIGEVR